jgi:hypothetical protein
MPSDQTQPRTAGAVDSSAEPPARGQSLSRRTLLVRALKLAVSLALLEQVSVETLALQAAPLPVPADSPDLERAHLAYAALQEHFFVEPHRLYHDFQQTHSRLDYPFASNWSFSVALRANLALASAPGASDELRVNLRGLVEQGLECYWDPAASAYNSEVLPPLGLEFGPDCFRFYDDNAHNALILLEYAQQTGETWALERAGEIFAGFIIDGVDRDNPVMTGGIRWAQTPDGAEPMDRCLVSNAPSAMLGFSLFRLTGDRLYYDWAAGMLNWCNAYLLDPADGLYWDKVRADGTLDRTKWSYNQGFMIGAYTTLYDLTGDSRFLHQAETTAQAALAYYPRQQRNGVSGFLHQDPDFNAVFFRAVLDLLAYSADPRLLAAAHQALESYRDQVWSSPDFHAPDHRFTLPCNSSPLRMQAAMVEIFALALPT